MGWLYFTKKPKKTTITTIITTIITTKNKYVWWLALSINNKWTILDRM